MSEKEYVRKELTAEELKMKELSKEELEKVAGGDIFDKLGCFFSGHGSCILKEIKGDFTSGFKVYKYTCRDCGTDIFEKHYNDGRVESISESTFNSSF